MAMIRPNDLTHENSVILEALTHRLQGKLHDHFKTQAEPVIVEMVRSCMADLKVDIERFRSHERMTDTIEFILKDSRAT